MLTTFIFYLFATVLIGSALAVVSARNPVHAVLFLILCFFNAAGLFVLMGAEFIAFILVIVYVGAVAVLFLFVVMMLDIDFRELRRGFISYLPIGAFVGLVLLLQITLVVGAWHIDPQALTAATPAEIAGAAAKADNTRAIGQVLYTDYFYPFQVSGLILLVAMIGAIVLTLRHSKRSRRQDVAAQLARQPADVIELVKVKTGEGVL
jgi:NADH-quinone oxidoreductase subunit J